MRPKHRRVLRLRQLRRQHELTQEELAKRVGITTNAYNAIEKGRATPALDTAVRIAALFNTPVETVFEYIDVKVPA